MMGLLERFGGLPCCPPAAADIRKIEKVAGDSRDAGPAGECMQDEIAQTVEQPPAIT